MPRLSDTGLQQHDNGSQGNFKAWINAKDLVGYPITIVSVKKVHKDDAYWPSGDFNPAHDEFVCGFQFDSEADAESVMFGDHEQGATYGFSTNYARIKSILQHITPEHLPLEGVVILVDEGGKFPSYYLGDSGSGEPATQEVSEPTRPTTSERGTPRPDSRNASSRGAASTPREGNRPAPTSNGGRQAARQTSDVPF